MPTLQAFPTASAHSRRWFLLAGVGVGFGLAACSRPSVTTESREPERQDLATMELRRADQRAQLCTAANAVGVGLRGEYFADEQWGGPPLLARIDGPVDFDKSLDWPADKALRPKSIRWSGWIKPPLSGKYRFHTGSIPGRVTLAQQLLGGPDGSAATDVELAAGRFYPITMEVRGLAAMTDRVRLEWTAPYGSRFVVPRALLYLPTESVNGLKS